MAHATKKMPQLLTNSCQDWSTTSIFRAPIHSSTHAGIPKNAHIHFRLNLINNILKSFALLLYFFFCNISNHDRGIVAVQVTFPSCTGILRVCDEDEDPWHNNPLKLTQHCQPNQLERKTLLLAGAAWQSAVNNLWIAQIILEEVMQVPVKIANVHGGVTDFYSYDNENLDILDGRVASWDALHTANTGSMDCHPSYLHKFVDVPADLTKRNCTSGCQPCAHAMLEVWPIGQEDLLDKYAADLKSIEYGGNLGVVGEFGWWASRYALEADPLLSSYRGLKDPISTQVFRRPLTFGEYCQRTYDDWSWIVDDRSAYALDVNVHSHFCHFFFSYTMQIEYGIAAVRNNPDYAPKRMFQVIDCANQIDSDVYIFYQLCKQFWVVTADIDKLLPLGAIDLVNRGYRSFVFLYRGFFVPAGENSENGILQTATCPSETLMPLSKSSDPFSLWNEETYGEQGYTRWKNYDRDIITSQNMSLSPYNMVNDIANTLELSGRLSQANKNESSPVLLSLSRPNSVFRRHLYLRHDKTWGNFGGYEFELGKVQLPDYDETCRTKRRTYEEKCSADPPAAGANQNDQCGYSQEILYKVFSSKLNLYAPEAYYMLRRFRMTTAQQEHILASDDYDPDYSDMRPAERARTVVCDWVRNNTAIWETWLPQTYDKVRCLGELGDALIQGETVIECSGHGTCQPTVTTEDLLKFPNAGICECARGYQQDDCSGLVPPDLINVTFESTQFYVFAVFIAITLLYTLHCFRMVYLCKNTSTVFKVSNTLFLNMNLWSVLVSLTGIFLWVGTSTVWHCVFRPIFLSIPYVLTMSSLFVKVFRKRIKRAVNDEDLIEIVSFACIIELCLFGFWFIAYRPSTKEVRLPDKVWYMYSTCDYGENRSAFEALLFVFSMLLSIVTIYLANEIRSVPSYFNESRDLLRTSAAITGFSLLGFAMANLFPPQDEQEKFAVIAITMLFDSWSVLGLLLRPKIRIHFDRPEINNLHDGLFRPLGSSDKLIFGENEEVSPESLGYSILAKLNLYQIIKKRRRRRMVVPGKNAPAADHRGTTDMVVAQTKGRKTKYRAGEASPAAIDNSNTAATTTNPDASRVDTAYRSPEMVMLLEKKYRAAATVNAQLMLILEEHHIDPETGDMDEDMAQVIRSMEEKQLEEIALMDELYQNQMEDLRSNITAERTTMRLKQREQNNELAEKQKLAMEKIKERAQDRKLKINAMQKESSALKTALQHTLPKVKDFLHGRGLSQYESDLSKLGYTEMQELLLIEEHELTDIGMKTGHIRKFQTALKTFQPAIEKKRMFKAPTRSKALMDGDADENTKKLHKVQQNVWKHAIDKKTGKKYWYNKALGKSVWKKPDDLVMLMDREAVNALMRIEKDGERGGASNEEDGEPPSVQQDENENTNEIGNDVSGNDAPSLAPVAESLAGETAGNVLAVENGKNALALETVLVVEANVDVTSGGGEVNGTGKDATDILGANHDESVELDDDKTKAKGDHNSRGDVDTAASDTAILKPNGEGESRSSVGSGTGTDDGEAGGDSGSSRENIGGRVDIVEDAPLAIDHVETKESLDLTSGQTVSNAGDVDAVDNTGNDALVTGVKSGVDSGSGQSVASPSVGVGVENGADVGSRNGVCDTDGAKSDENYRESEVVGREKVETDGIKESKEENEGKRKMIEK